jgi:hypothetical protein
MAKGIKPKKKSKYDLTIKSNLSPDELLKLAANTAPVKKKAAVRKRSS